MQPARLWLQIGTTLYACEPIPNAAGKAWRLTKADATTHDVHAGPFGLLCTCPDFLWRRRESSGELCKHLAALSTLGMFR